MQTTAERLLRTGDEDRFLVVFVIEQRLLLQTLLDERERERRQAEARQEEEQVLGRLQQRENQLRQRLDEVARKPPAGSGDPAARFEITNLYYQRGRIELFVVLGLVYAAVKDYESVRNSLRRLLRDMENVIRGVLDLDQSPWVILPEIRSTSAEVQDSAGRGQSRQRVVNVSPEDNRELPLERAPQPPARWDVSRWIVLYLIVSNILLITLLGLLLLLK